MDNKTQFYIGLIFNIINAVFAAILIFNIDVLNMNMDFMKFAPYFLLPIGTVFLYIRNVTNGHGAKAYRWRKAFNWKPKSRRQYPFKDMMEYAKSILDNPKQIKAIHWNRSHYFGRIVGFKDENARTYQDIVSRVKDICKMDETEVKVLSTEIGKEGAFYLWKNSDKKVKGKQINVSNELLPMDMFLITMKPEKEGKTGIIHAFYNKTYTENIETRCVSYSNNKSEFGTLRTTERVEAFNKIFNLDSDELMEYGTELFVDFLAIDKALESSSRTSSEQAEEVSEPINSEENELDDT